ncbi:MAG: hypothetical protein VX777_09715 [Chlamydiota bacterium]|nr:hypothetical protein [Chlamydiota bacterium]
MNFAEEDLEFYIEDLSEMLEEFEEMSPEERKECEQMEADVRSILSRLEKHEELTEDEQEDLIDDIDSLYDFMDQIDELNMDDIDPEDINTGDISEFAEQMKGFISSLSAQEGETDEELANFKKEMGSIFEALGNPDKLDLSKIEELQEKVGEIENSIGTEVKD